MLKNEYIPFASEILSIRRHTAIEYSFRMRYEGAVKPGQFFEVSMPRYGEAPISVSGIGEGWVELTIRRVGRVTGEIFENYVGDRLMLRGPYGNGFELDEYRRRDLIVVAGGTGLSPVRGVVEHFAAHPEERGRMALICGFKTPRDLLFAEDIERWRARMDVTVTFDDAQGGEGLHQGLVTRYIPELQVTSAEDTAAIVVGPPAMMRFSALELLKLGLPEKNIWISQERKMCCGLGKCGHCKIGEKYVCLDGPVFNYAQGKALVD